MRVQCGCGWIFQMQESVVRSGQAKCPSCGNPIALQTPQQGGGGSGAQKQKLMLAGIGGVILVLVIVIVVLLTSGDEPAPLDRGETTRTPPTTPKKPETKKPEPKKPEPKKPDPPKKQDPAPPVKPPEPKKVEEEPKKPAPPPESPFPGTLVTTVKTKVLALPPFYRDSVVSEGARKRAEGLLARGKGTITDLAFLESLTKSPTLELIAQEKARIEAEYAKYKETGFKGLPMDRIVLKDGTTKDGTILERSPESVKFEMSFGSGKASRLYPMIGVKQLLPGLGSGKEFKSKWRRIDSGSLEGTADLLKWCLDNGHAEPARLVCWTALRKDPGNAPARVHLELPLQLGNVVEAGETPEPGNVTSAPAESNAESVGGKITFQGKEWDPKELKDRLLSKGYALFNGKWHAPAKRTYSVANLYRHEKDDRARILIAGLGAPEGRDLDTEFVPSLSPNGTYTIREQVKELRKFYAPPLIVTRKTYPHGKPGVRIPNFNFNTADLEYWEDEPQVDPGMPVTGRVEITVPFEHPVIDGSVRLLAEMARGSTIEVTLVTNGAPRQLYRGSSAPRGSLDLPKEHVQGMRSLRIQVTLSALAAYDKERVRKTLIPLKLDPGTRRIIQKGKELVYDRLIPRYNAVLFPSVQRTPNVFRFQGNVGLPAPGLNNAFEKAGATDLLK